MYTWVFNILKAVLIWLVGVLIMIPLSTLSIYWDLRLLITFMVFFAFSFFMMKGLIYLDEMLDFISWYLSYKWSERQSTDRKNMPLSRAIRRKGLDIVTIVLIYLILFAYLIEFASSCKWCCDNTDNISSVVQLIKKGVVSFKSLR